MMWMLPPERRHRQGVRVRRGAVRWPRSAVRTAACRRTASL